ncbi:hypothetical protein [Enterococcus sp. BWR-S5]|uniref:hypothetical protein n=1 Tax=Enterococcus sp. BWR-S5 TaxID=2787714 RepID=UPI0019221F70|nr:hypothetical protein [Enterococcus sp. BWR-S5]MBL1225141.1 hypothetical protein [Enterococcus sp. BWR-S5]
MKSVKKVFGMIVVLLATVLIATGCTNANNAGKSADSTSSESEKKDKNNIEGSWFSESGYVSRELSIDDTDAILSSTYSDKIGTVDKDEKTITLKESGSSEKVYTYKMINKKLVLENEEDNEVFTFTREAPTSESSSSEESSESKKSTKAKSDDSSSTKESSKEKDKDSSSSSTEKATGEQMYADAFIEVSKENSIISFKNLTQDAIRLSGEATLNGERVINMYDFGVIGDIAASGVKTQTVSKVKVTDIGDSSEKEAGETLGGDKLVYHEMKAGETITWSGKILNDDYDTLAQISFTINY